MSTINTALLLAAKRHKNTKYCHRDYCHEEAHKTVFQTRINPPDRWRIETLFRQVKTNFSADVLRSQTPAGTHKEIAARLVAVNIVRTIMLEAAIAQDVEPMRISFVHAVRAIISFSPAFATEAFWRLPQIYRAMLVEIAAHLTEERPDRIEPRMIKREWQHYPSMKITRSQGRAKYVA